MDTLITGLRVVVSLAAVLGLLWVIQKKVAKSGRVTRQAKHVTVVARQGLSGKASLTVVDVEGIRYVLGVTEQSVNVLASGETPQDARITPIASVASVPIAAEDVEAAERAAAERVADPETASSFASAPAFAAALTEAQVADEYFDRMPFERESSRHSAGVDLGPRRATRAVALTPPYRRGQAPTQPAGPYRRGRTAVVQSTSPVAGSILSAATWRQAAAAMRAQKRA